jgi:hypothetical protein
LRLALSPLGLFLLLLPASLLGLLLRLLSLVLLLRLLTLVLLLGLMLLLVALLLLLLLLLPWVRFGLAVLPPIATVVVVAVVLFVFPRITRLLLVILWLRTLARSTIRWSLEAGITTLPTIVARRPVISVVFLSLTWF